MISLLLPVKIFLLILPRPFLQLARDAADEKLLLHRLKRF